MNPTPFTPQSTMINVPIGGGDQLKSLLLNETLLFEDAEAALDEILVKIGEVTDFPPSHTRFRDLIDGITSQTEEGGLYADVPMNNMDAHIPAAARLSRPQPAGGGGLAWFFYTPTQRQRISVVFLMGAFSDSSPLAFERIPFVYAVRGIHELVHNAPNDLGNDLTTPGRLYQHDEMDEAARELGSTHFDQYVKEHCIPQRYW